MGMLEAILLTIVTAATPLLIAALGELVVERSGVLNLGVEGMMVMGAVCGFAVALTDRLALARRARRRSLAGALFSLLFGFLTLTLVANQVATGLALTLLGLGLSGMIGESFVGQPGIKLPQPRTFPVLSDIPLVGRLLFGQDPIFYLSILLDRRRHLVPVPHPRRPDAALGRRQPRLGPCAGHQRHRHTAISP